MLAPYIITWWPSSHVYLWARHLKQSSRLHIRHTNPMNTSSLTAALSVSSYSLALGASCREFTVGLIWVFLNFATKNLPRSCGIASAQRRFSRTDVRARQASEALVSRTSRQPRMAIGARYSFPLTGTRFDENDPSHLFGVEDAQASHWLEEVPHPTCSTKRHNDPTGEAHRVKLTPSGIHISMIRINKLLQQHPWLSRECADCLGWS